MKRAPAIFFETRTGRRWASLSVAIALVLIAVGVGALAVGRTDDLGSTGSAHAAQERPEVMKPVSERPVRVMPLGDSITHGLQHPGGYRRHLWQLSRAAGVPLNFVGSQRNGDPYLDDPDHEGHPGWQIQQLDRYVSSWLRIYRPDIVLLHIGSNNYWRQGELPELAPARLARLIDRISAAAPRAQLYVATLIPSGHNDARVRQFNSTLPAILTERAERGVNVTLVDQHAALTSADLIDGIHPKEQGYVKMAACWWRAMNKDLRTAA